MNKEAYKKQSYTYNSLYCKQSHSDLLTFANANPGQDILEKFLQSWQTLDPNVIVSH